MGQSRQTDLVGSYFDQISPSYRRRYESENPFHSYFFRERLAAATAGHAFEGKSVLDIGAGTGPLYDELSNARGVDYFACDISEKMLLQSAIPASRRFVGKATDVHFPRDKFDFIFMLGVTTYQSAEDLEQTMAFIGQRLARDGRAIISFTNRRSLDHVLRGAIRLAKPLLRKGVIAQGFETRAYGLNDVQTIARRNTLSVAKVTYQNHTFSPFNTLMPRPSVVLTKWLKANCAETLLPFLSSDFVVTAARKS